MNIENENEIVVCEHCGKNGDEVTLEERGKYIVRLDRNGNYEDIPESEYAESIYCYNCQVETELVTLAEYKRIGELNLILEKNIVTINKETLAVELAQHRIAFMEVKGLLKEDDILYYDKDNKPLYTPEAMILGEGFYQHYLTLIESNIVSK